MHIILDADFIGMDRINPAPSAGIPALVDRHPKCA